MRDILFKAKRICVDCWLEGGFCKSTNGRTFLAGVTKRGLIDGFEVIPETICQYTGLTDKNGNKIWENDILKGLFLHGMEVSAVVVFKDGAFGLKWNRGNVEEFSPFTSICNVSFEIIGNIFDNPELLEGGA